MNKVIIAVVVVLLIITGVLYIPKSNTKDVECVKVHEEMTIKESRKIEEKCNELLSQNSKEWEELEEEKKPFIDRQAELSKESEKIRLILSQSDFTKAPQHEQAKLFQNKKLAKTKNLSLVK